MERWEFVEQTRPHVLNCVPRYSEFLGRCGHTGPLDKQHLGK